MRSLHPCSLPSAVLIASDFLPARGLERSSSSKELKNEDKLSLRGIFSEFRELIGSSSASSNLGKEERMCVLVDDRGRCTRGEMENISDSSDIKDILSSTIVIPPTGVRFILD